MTCVRVAGDCLSPKEVSYIDLRWNTRRTGEGWHHSLNTALRIFIESCLRHLLAIVHRLMEWQERAARRYELENLSDEQLRDIGVTRTELRRQLNKPRW